MWKKVTLGAFALLLGLLANTHMVCRVSIDGEAVEGCYSPWAHDRGLLAAVKAADEILEGSTSLPAVKTGYGLSLRPPAGSAAELSGAVLEAARGIELRGLADGKAAGLPILHHAHIRRQRHIF